MKNEKNLRKNIGIPVLEYELRKEKITLLHSIFNFVILKIESDSGRQIDAGCAE